AGNTTLDVQVLAFHPSKFPQGLGLPPQQLRGLGIFQDANTANLRCLRNRDARCDENAYQRPAEAAPRQCSLILCHPLPSADGIDKRNIEATIGISKLEAAVPETRCRRLRRDTNRANPT